MNKQEILGYMEKRLEILNKSERQDILAEYSQHIANKMASGLTEEEAIKDFGDIDDFIDDILAAYKVDPDYKHKRVTFEYGISRFLKKFGRIVTAISDEIANHNKKDLMAIIVKFLIVVLVLIIAKLPVDLIIDMFARIFDYLPDFLDGILTGAVNLCISVVYIVVFCYTIYAFIKKTLLANYDFDSEEEYDFANRSQNHSQYQEQQQRGAEKKSSIKKKFFKRKEQRYMEDEYLNPTPNASGQNTTENDPGKNSPLDVVGIVNEADENGKIPSDETVLNNIKERAQKGKAKPQPGPNQKSGGLGDFIINVFVICLKILVVICMLPVAGIALGGIVAFGVLFSLMIQGLPLVGTTLVAFGGMLCLIAFVTCIFNLLFKGGAH